jgi:hypothetical protein
MSVYNSINYFRQYVPIISQVTAPIDALRNEKDIAFKWGPAQQHSFEMLKDILKSNNILHHADCCIPPTILHRHNSKESTVHLCHTRTLSDNPIRLTRPA